MAAVNVAALLFIVMYYFAVVVVGVWGGRKGAPTEGHSIGSHGLRVSKRKSDDDDFLLRLFVANRELPRLLGVASMTATWVGGGYLNGTAEAVYKYGIVNCQAPIGYAMSLVLGGAFFANKMRLTDSLTMLDPFQTHYGRWTGLMFCVPAVLGEIFWTAAILAALGDTASVIIRVDSRYFIIISALIVFFYTSLGGLFSVTYTDGFQLATTAILLWTCVPSCVSHKAVGTLGPQYTDWIGSLDSEDASQLVDFFLMTALGGIPWQVYFQRVLACETVAEAKILSFMAAVGCIFLAVPPVIIGVAAKHTNFTVAGYPGSYQLDDEDSPRVLPFAILYLTSGMKAIFGLVSIAAAVMSSADSSMLSASTMITRNVYQTLLRPTATEKEVVIALRTMICALGSLSVYMALSVNSVFYLWTLCSDIVYVLLFPQLLCVFYFKETNAYGSVLAFIVSGVFRCLCGEPSMNVPVVVRLPLYDPKLGQRFPFRLLSMALGLATLRLGSYVAAALFRSGLLSDRYDVFHCFVKPPLMCQPRETSIASFDHATGAPGSMGSENTPGAPSGTQRISTADTASEREASSKGVSKDNRRLWDATELPDELQHGNRLSTKKFSLASCGISSLELGGAITGTRGFLTASTASEREAITWGASRDNRSMSVAAGPTDEAQGGGGPTRRKSSLTSDRRSLVVQSGSAPTGARHVSITDLASEGEAITWGFSKKNRTQSVAAEPADEAQAGGGPIGKKSSLASVRRRSPVMQSGMALESYGAADKSLSEGASTPTRTSRKRSKSAGAKGARKETGRRRSSVMQSGMALESSGAADKSLSEGASTATRTSRKRSKSAGAKGRRKETRRKSASNKSD